MKTWKGCNNVPKTINLKELPEDTKKIFEKLGINENNIKYKKKIYYLVRARTLRSYAVEFFLFMALSITIWINFLLLFTQLGSNGFNLTTILLITSTISLIYFISKFFRFENGLSAWDRYFAEYTLEVRRLRPRRY